MVGFMIILTILAVAASMFGVWQVAGVCILLWFALGAARLIAQ